MAEQDFKELERKYKEQAAAAIEFAEQSDAPGLETLLEDVLA